MVDHQLLVPPPFVPDHLEPFLTERLGHIGLDGGKIDLAGRKRDERVTGPYIDEPVGFGSPLVVIGESFEKIGPLRFVEVAENVGAASDERFRIVRRFGIGHRLPDVLRENRNGAGDIGEKGGPERWIAAVCVPRASARST
jgi:hypothetical protein